MDCPFRNRAAGSALLILITLAATQSGCAVYVADQQSARLLEAGEWEATPSFSSVSFSADGETEHVQNQFGLRFGYGASERVEVRAVVERIEIDDDFGDDGYTLVGGGPKWSLAEGTAALFLPVGAVFGEDVETSETWTVAPTVLLTLDAAPTVEVNPSFKVIYPFAAEEAELLLGANLGAGIAIADGKVVLRPEAGLVINPGEDGVSWGWTLGASLRP